MYLNKVNYLQLPVISPAVLQCIEGEFISKLYKKKSYIVSKPYRGGEEPHMKNNIIFKLSVILIAIIISGCYVVPLDERGYPIFPYPPQTYDGQITAPPSPHQKTGPITISARLYPANEQAAETGVVTGTVTNKLTGKGLFNLSYRGETYTGEATRVSNDSRRGVASAFSPNGGYMSCEYQMNTPRQGAGTCIFSNGAKYDLHLGN